MSFFALSNIIYRFFLLLFIKTRICYPQNAVLLGVKPLKPQEITRFQDFRPFSLSTPVSTPLSTLCPGSVHPSVQVNRDCVHPLRLSMVIRIYSETKRKSILCFVSSRNRLSIYGATFFNSFSISSIVGMELLKSSGMTFVSSYSEIPIGALIILTAYWANTLSFVLHMSSPTV